MAIESDQPIFKTADELGINKNTLHTWISKYHSPQKRKVARVEEEPFYDELKSLRNENKRKRVFDLVKDFGTSQSSKIDSIFDSLLCPDRPAYVTIPYCTSTASCSCTTPS
ncbi:MAG: transposase [Candidatus Thiodiazotropha sp. (ex Lucinoma aequizonata)]|nr:transposase [Candidatus Thiodiazotropha sp. (ex Lucinoma aequizonata)]